MYTARMIILISLNFLTSCSGYAVQPMKITAENLYVMTTILLCKLPLFYVTFRCCWLFDRCAVRISILLFNNEYEEGIRNEWACTLIYRPNVEVTLKRLIWLVPCKCDFFLFRSSLPFCAVFVIFVVCGACVCAMMEEEPRCHFTALNV